MIEEFARDGRVAVSTISTLGHVHTGIAVRSGEDAPLIGTSEELRASLATATRLYVPDLERATAGIHFVKVLRALGLHDGAAPPIASYPNGASAMAALAASTERGALGCTQITEIKSTPGYLALRYLINRETGRGAVGSLWDTDEALNAAAKAAEERRAMGEQRGISFGDLSKRETVFADLP